MIEPITLTDPDGAVTRLAPSSTWNREQVRAPGGEPALVTRLDSGQLWFAAGRRRSPWRHEVHVGAAVVSTPDGRFQAIAEGDGGATIVCLAGRARIVTGLGDPVLLHAEESAAVSGDGETLLVMDRVVGDERAFEPDEPASVPPDRPLMPVVVETAAERNAAEEAGEDATADQPAPVSASGLALIEPARRWRPREWVPEITVVAAVVALLVAVAMVFGGGSDGDSEQAAAPVTASSTTTATTRPPTTRPPTTRPPTTRPPTTQPPTTRPPTTQPPATAPTAAPQPARVAVVGAFATGELVGCQRVPGGVKATVDVISRGGPASWFRLLVGLRDSNGAVVAQAEGLTDRLPPGGGARVEVLVPVQGPVTGVCEVLGVVSG